MGSNNQQRRAAKKRQRSKAAAGHRPAPPDDLRARISAVFPAADPSPVTREQVRGRAAELIRVAAGGLGGATGSGPRDDMLVELAVFDGWVPVDLRGVHEEVATEFLLLALRESYAQGWQPADVVHIVLRRGKSRPAAAFTQRLIGHEARLSNAYDRAPERWIDQLPARTDRAWQLLAEATNSIDGWGSVVTALAAMAGLPRLEALLAPPSGWAAGPARPAARGSGHLEPKMLARVRALLAKAEATEFGDEAESFTAKAQELMARYAIDEALLADPGAGIDVQGRRLHLDDPYAEQKATLVNVCAQAQHCKAILFAELGLVTVVGPPIELDLTEMLYTSLLVQAVRAMTDAGRHAHDRSPSFRRAFLVAFADRIGERLQESTARVESEVGAELVPVRARTRAAVDAEFERLFPRTTPGRSRSYDARGWHAGRAAAEDAVLVRGRIAGA